MKKKRIALITESTARKEQAVPAYEFYQGPKNQWVNKIVEYMTKRNFPKKNAYFVSYFDNRIFGYEEVITKYGETEKQTAAERMAFAQKIVDFLKTTYEGEELFVELHLSKLRYDKLIFLLEEEGIEYKLYADVPLGMKPLYYNELIETECVTHKAKEIKNAKFQLIKLVPNKTPAEAKVLYDQYKDRAKLFGLEKDFEELKKVLKDYWQAKKAVDVAYTEASVLVYAANNNELTQYFSEKDMIVSLFDDIALYEMLNKLYSKEISKIERYLIKFEYQKQKERIIAGLLLRIQISLLKSA